MIFNLAATGTAGFPKGKGEGLAAAPNSIDGVAASQCAEAGTAGAASLPAFSVICFSATALGHSAWP
jgi:hypothetical protein